MVLVPPHDVRSTFSAHCREKSPCVSNARPDNDHVSQRFYIPGSEPQTNQGIVGVGLYHGGFVNQKDGIS